VRSALRAALVAALMVGAVPASSLADVENGELYVPWTDRISEQRSVAAFSGESTSIASDSIAGPGISGLTLVGNADKDGTVNSDLAFWGNQAYAGNYGGFRILDISGDQPRVITDFACNGPQNDVSVHRMGGKRYLFQAIDAGQTKEECDSQNAPLDADGRRTGYEGVRVFDVTNPAKPRFVDMIQTACGAHTQTLVPAGNKAYIYVSSYPLGSGRTTAEGPGDDFRPCQLPHKKISVIEVSDPPGPEGFDFRRKEVELSDDTTPNRGFQACHDVQAFLATDTAIGSCAGDGQIWDISDPWNPTLGNSEPHTHINSPSSTDSFEFIHAGVVTWDGEYFAIMDETGGGGTANCFGDATTDGYYYFYEMVEPGDPAPALESRYMIPRDQGSEVCVSHNASVIPVAGRYVMSAAYYQGGVTVVDFTDVANPTEIAYADLEDGVGQSDEWSSYWYNGRIFSNGGLNRRTSNRGLDVFRPDASLGLGGAATWARSNPQTQEAWQAP